MLGRVVRLGLAGHRRGAALGSEDHPTRTAHGRRRSRRAGRGTDASLVEQRRDDLPSGCASAACSTAATSARTHSASSSRAALPGAARRRSSSSATVRRPQYACRAMNAARRFSPTALATAGRIAVEELERDRRVDVGEDLRHSTARTARAGSAAGSRVQRAARRGRRAPPPARRALVSSEWREIRASPSGLRARGQVLGAHERRVHP
jgi:hypothetical protein